MKPVNHNSGGSYVVENGVRVPQHQTKPAMMLTHEEKINAANGELPAKTSQKQRKNAGEAA